MEDSGQNLKSKNTLKTFFQKGDIPEEEQFADLIDAFRHMDDGHTITNVFTAPNGIISITLSNGTVVAITPPVSDEYVPKTGGGFTGEVGVGTDTPNAILEVKGTFSPTRPHLAVNSVDDHVSFHLQHQGVSKGYIWYNAGIDKMAFGKGISARHTFFIDGNDNFGIGTNSPEKKLHIDGGVVRIQSPSGYGDIGSRNGDWFHFETDRPNFWFNTGVRSNGNLGLYNKNTYMRFSDGAIFENNQRVATQNWGNTNFVSKTKDENNAFFNDYLIFNHNSTTDVDAISFNPTTNGFYFNAATGKSNSSANASVYVNKVIAFDDIATAESVHVAGNVYAGAGSQGSAYFGDGKEIIRFNDEWLRLNPSTTSATRFDEGIYCGTGKLRTDGQFEVGSNGDKFKVTTSGAVSAAGTLTTGSNIGITPGHGKGFRFWGSDSYKVYMSSSTDGTWGGRVNGETTSDYNMYFRMTGGTNRGFVFKNDHNEVAGIDASGNARFNGTIYEGGTTLSNKYLGKTAKATDSEKVDGINGASLLRSDANDTFTGTLSVGSSSTRQAGIYGIYDSTKIGHIWSMGTGFKINQTGTNFGNLYGFAYKHTNNPTGGTMAGNHQAVWCSNGTPKVALGDNIWTSGIIYEGGTALSNKYLGKTAKATDSDKLDGIDSTGFVRDGIDSHRSWNNEYLIFTHNGADNVDAISYDDVNNAFHFNADRSKTKTSSNAKVYAGTLYEGSTALTNKYLGKTAKAADSEKVDGINGASLLRSDANDTFTGTLSVGSSSTRQAGIYGIYDSTKVGHIWSMGTGYKISQSGANFGNLYGFAYKHTNNPTGGTMAGNHQAVWCSNGTPKVALGDNIWTSGTMYANGSITSAGNVTAYSDKRLKTALEPIKENILDKIDQLTPTFYQWKDKAKDQAKQLGFIAQEVKEVFPEWVHENEEYYSMSYDKMGAVLAVQGIQELRAEIKSLKEELKSLKDGFTK